MSQSTRTHHRPPSMHASASHGDRQSPPSPSSSSSSQPPAYQFAPYTDYPPEKSESALEHPSTLHAHVPCRLGIDALEPRAQSPGSGSFGSRPMPSTFDDIWSATCSKVSELRGRSCGAAGSGLGKGLIIGWIVTTLMFIAATAFWKGELFSALDRLSNELKEMGYQGQAYFALLIFITTIPPLPLYSTLMVLSGYTFGTWDGFVISYMASLVGAVVVFIAARTFLRDAVTKCLSSSPTSVSLLSIIPAKPHLLLLIRVAPYPYNLLNVILASSPNLSLQTYTACTALSLCKVILHAWFGAGLHDLSELHGNHPSSPSSIPPPSPSQPSHSHRPPHSLGSFNTPDRDDVRLYGTYGGVILCVILFVYLHHIAKRALARAQEEAEREATMEQGQAGLVEIRPVS